MVNEKLLCDLCGKAILSNTKDKHIDSSLCKGRRNVNRYSELIGGNRTMDEKHIANGDVDFDGVIEIEPREQQNKIEYLQFKHTICIMLICFIVGTTFKYIMIYNHILLTSLLGQLVNIL